MAYSGVHRDHQSKIFWRQSADRWQSMVCSGIQLCTDKMFVVKNNAVNYLQDGLIAVYNGSFITIPPPRVMKLYIFLVQFLIKNY